MADEQTRNSERVRAAEILGSDRKLAAAIATADHYPDKRMTPAIAMWLRDKHIQSPDEYSADIEEFRSLRRRLKDLKAKRPSQRTQNGVIYTRGGFNIYNVIKGLRFLTK